MKSKLESFIDLIHERIWSMAIFSTKSSNEILCEYHCYICNIILQMIFFKYFIDLIHERIWSVAIFSTKSSNEILWIYHCYICNIILQMISFKYFIDLIHEIRGNFGKKVKIFKWNITNYVCNCYICNITFQSTQWNLIYNLLLIWFMRGSDPWQF